MGCPVLVVVANLVMVSVSTEQCKGVVYCMCAIWWLSPEVHWPDGTHAKASTDGTSVGPEDGGM